MNFDGVSFGNPGPMAYECVMRDSQSHILWVKGASIGSCDSTHAETHRTVGMVENDQEEGS